MTGETLYRGMFRYKANEAMITWMKSTERDILQRVEVIDAGFLVFFLHEKELKTAGTY